MSGFFAPLGVLVIAAVVALAVGDGGVRRTVLVAGAVTGGVWAVRTVSTGFSQIAALAESGGVERYVTPVLKCVGVSWTCGFCALSLRELGAPNAAALSEIVGAAELALVAIPLLSELTSLALSVL